MITPRSPSLLTPPTGGPGVRRLNRLPRAIAFGVCVIVLATVGYTMVQKHKQKEIETDKQIAETKTQGGKAPAFLNTASPQGDVRRTLTDPPATRTPAATSAPATGGDPTLEEQARSQAWVAYYQSMAQSTAAQNALVASAHSGNLDALSGHGPSGGENQQGGSDGPGKREAAYSQGGVNPAGQTGKQAFLKQAGDIMGDDEDLAGAVHGPKPSTIMEGTGIPIRLVEGATSDMPGQVNAEVLQNVYDTMSGDLLLIPQGTRVVGTYDIAVSNGQERLGIIWQRLIFPDTSSRQIGSMSGADQGGLAGMKDLVDTHFWQKFGSAVMISLIGAGAQLSQPQQSSFATPTQTSSAIGAMTNQMSQFGQEQARAGMNIPNTIELRPGLIGLIKVTKDMKLPMYVDSRG